MKKNKIQKFRRKGLPAVKQGMSLMEVIVGIFILGAVMLATTFIFSGSFNGYRKADKLQKNIENAQYAINMMTKSLRTSRIYDFTSSTILAFDYSEGLCNQYTFSSGGQITRASASSTSLDCAVTLGDPISIAEQYVYGAFSGSASVAPVSGLSSGSVGRVTIVTKVCSNEDCAGSDNDQAVLQTTVSLRDYATVGM